MSTTGMSQSAPPEPKALPNVSFLEAVLHRRSVYALTKNSPVPDSTIVQLAHDIVRHVPSSFNSQSSRIVVLLGDEHDKWWDMALEEHLKAAGDDEGKKERTKPRIVGFKAAYGTALFFESTSTVNGFQQKFPPYSTLFPPWSEQTSAMAQFTFWTALESMGPIGANLQHYQYIQTVTERSREMYKLPQDWDLKAQLVFGGLSEGAFPTEPKEKLPVEETVRVFGAK